MGIPRFLRYLLSDKLSPCVQILHTHSSSHVKGERSTTLLFSRKKWRCGPLIHPWRLKMIHMWHAVVGCFFPAFVQLHSDWRWPFLFIWNKKDSMKTMQVIWLDVWCSAFRWVTFFPSRSFLWGMFVKVNAIFVGVVPSARDAGDEKCHHGLK